MTTCACYLFRLITLIIGLIGIVGCGFTHVIKSTDLTQLQTGSPLKSVQPTTFALKEFKATRGNDNLYVLDNGLHKWKLYQLPAEIVNTAIRKELQRNGHICIDYSPQLKAGFIIEGTVYKYSVRADSGAFGFRLITNVAVKLTISDASTDGAPLIRNYEGEGFAKKGNLFFGPTPIKLLNQAQLKMLQEFSTDIELIAFLKK